MNMISHITGQMILGFERISGDAATFEARDASTGLSLSPGYGSATAADVAKACELARQAFPVFRATSPEARAAFLDKIAQGIVQLGDDLIQRAHLESGLPTARLAEERDRTVRQLQFFATLVREGRDQAPIVDSALPDRTPPRPDLRVRRVPVGPVAVFGASNFPLAFSVAGGDTASALAAGCPVVVKAHEAHPGTSELVGLAIVQAARQTDMPEGVFSLLFANDFLVGQALVQHPAIQAVGFTGSRRGGEALLRLAQSRPQPIPLYAEMSAINPVFLLPAALANRGADIAAGFVGSLSARVGQLCTNPGLLVVLQDAALASFETKLGEQLSRQSGAPMLTAGICAAWHRGMHHLQAHPKVQLLGGHPDQGGMDQASPVMFRTDVETFLNDPELSEENFGPSSLLVVCRSTQDLSRLIAHLQGQLTATLLLDQDDHALAAELIAQLELVAGRILINGYPTGVEVCTAMVHGGPWPATSDSRTTSVGGTAIDRFLRPVCYQNMPDALLPSSLQRQPHASVWRFEDGAYLKAGPG